MAQQQFQLLVSPQDYLALQQKSNTQQAMIDKLTKQNKELYDKIYKLKQMKDAQTAQKNRVTLQLENMSIKYRDVSSQIENLKISVQKMASELTASEKKINAINELMQQSLTNCQNMEKQLAQSREQSAIRQKLVTQLQQKINQVQKKNQETNQQNISLKQQLASLKSIKQKVQLYRNQISNLQQTLKCTKFELQTLQNNRLLLQNQQKAYQSTIGHLETNIVKQQNNIKELQSYKSKYITLESRYSLENEQFTKQLKDKQEQLNSLERMFKQNMDKMKDVVSRLATLENENKQIQDRYKDMSRKYEQLQQTYTYLQKTAKPSSISPEKNCQQQHLKRIKSLEQQLKSVKQSKETMEKQYEEIIINLQKDKGNIYEQSQIELDKQKRRRKKSKSKGKQHHHRKQSKQIEKEEHQKKPQAPVLGNRKSQKDQLHQLKHLLEQYFTNLAVNLYEVGNLDQGDIKGILRQQEQIVKNYITDIGKQFVFGGKGHDGKCTQKSGYGHYGNRKL